MEPRLTINAQVDGIRLTMQFQKAYPSTTLKMLIQ